MDKVKLAEWLHDNYEELAKANDWQTQEITRVKFDDLPQANKNTMLALADRLHNTFLIIARQALVSGQFCRCTGRIFVTSENGVRTCNECMKRIS